MTTPSALSFADPDFLAFQQALAAEYSLERELGRGGMGVVYLAREVRLDRYVAIKLLPSALAARAELRERFLREARTAAKLSHPHIVQIHRVDEVAGFVFFVMAFVDGDTLGARVRERGPLPIGEATRTLREIAWALAYAHVHGVVHRDVKPDNIMIERETGRAIVTDFGIARVGGEPAEGDATAILGTAHFMSPEQAAGQPLDGRSDLYSLGIVGHYALTGRLPFDAPTTRGVMAMHLAQPVPSVARAAPGAPRAIADAIERCLAKSPAARWSTGEELADALEAAAERRRVTPAPIRVWLARRSTSGGVATVVAYLAGVTLVPMRGPVWLLPVLGVPLATYFGSKIHKTRRVFEAGFVYDDLIRGLREYQELRSEELAFDRVSRRVARIGGLLRGASYTFLAGGMGSMIASVLVHGGRLSGPFMKMFAVGLATGMATGLTSLFFPSNVDQRARWRLKFWRGPIGQWIARAAEVGVRRTGTQPQLTHRATEVAIGLAAEELFRTLPRETRRELAALPDVIKRLETEAKAIRARLELLASQSDAARGEAGDAEALRAQHEGAERQLATVVTTLQTIRLDLLRLHGGANTIASLTTAIEAAQELGRQIGYAVEARREVDAALIARPLHTPV